MDFYKEYIQTNYISEVESYKKKGYEVINVHTKHHEGEITVFTLGLSYKTAYEKVQQMVLDLENKYSKDEFFTKIAEGKDEKIGDYSSNSTKTDNELTNWLVDYDKLIHDLESVYGKADGELYF